MSEGPTVLLARLITSFECPDCRRPFSSGGLSFAKVTGAKETAALAGCSASRPVGPRGSGSGGGVADPDATVPADAGTHGVEQEVTRVAPRDGAEARVVQPPSTPIPAPGPCPRASVSTAEASFDVWQVPVPFCLPASGVADAGESSPEGFGWCALRAASPVSGERGTFDEARTRDAMPVRPGHRVCCYVACVMPGMQKQR